MGKRIFLFLLTNLAVILVLSIIVSVFGLGRYVSPEGQLQLIPLALFCLVWGMGGAFISLLMSRWVAKRAMGVQLVNGQTGNAELDWLYNTVSQQAQVVGLPMPEVGVYDSPEVNAFATGPSKKRSLVAVSTGLLRTMQHNEAAAVIGHELGHIKNGDMVTMTLLQGVINAFVMFLARIVAFVIRQRLDSRFANFIAFGIQIALQIVLGVLGAMVVAAFSRYREFHADAAGAQLAGRGNMISALQRLKATVEQVDNSAPALAAYKISNRPAWLGLFSTHPPLETRIEALERMQV
ncbi:MAG TPA: protease HtpX [Thermoanaerobaculia bacterium]|nr:protease HtpX [Thermoanaerobaculia bacterium]